MKKLLFLLFPVMVFSQETVKFSANNSKEPKFKLSKRSYVDCNLKIDAQTTGINILQIYSDNVKIWENEFGLDDQFNIDFKGLNDYLVFVVLNMERKNQKPYDFDIVIKIKGNENSAY